MSEKRFRAEESDVVEVVHIATTLELFHASGLVSILRRVRVKKIAVLREGDDLPEECVRAGENKARRERVAKSPATGPRSRGTSKMSVPIFLSMGIAGCGTPL